MRSRKFNFSMLSLFFCLTFLTGYAFADNSVTSPVDFFGQVMKAIGTFGGLPWVLKVASIVTLAIASMKVSFLNQLVWSKLGKFQAWAAPVLGLLAGLLGLAGTGPLTLSSIFAYLSAGAGAIILHELLDTVKSIPGLGAVYVSLIDTIEKLLGGPASEPPVVQV